jgi:hypothetical protein
MHQIRCLLFNVASVLEDVKVILLKRFSLRLVLTFLASLWVPLSARPLKAGLIGCPKTLVSNCQSALYNIPEEQRPHLLFTDLYDADREACLALVEWPTQGIFDRQIDSTLICLVMKLSFISVDAWTLTLTGTGLQFHVHSWSGGQDSVGGIVIHKVLNIQGSKPGEGKVSVPVHNDPGAHTSLYSMDIRSLSWS